ncbi:hypothetical protein B0H17DRAFT_1124669 [Mycena rosella]|uniref:Uncharacterized protein n=1 Tax=Mycena rosella TaxID=1033263 RepID=A0AAD7MBG0_MYCRO|nr:hypothetical protein B0H17DRAFT_1124669 [Mycena rosella]
MPADHSRKSLPLAGDSIADPLLIDEDGFIIHPPRQSSPSRRAKSLPPKHRQIFTAPPSSIIISAPPPTKKPVAAKPEPAAARVVPAPSANISEFDYYIQGIRHKEPPNYDRDVLRETIQEYQARQERRLRLMQRRLQRLKAMQATGQQSNTNLTLKIAQIQVQLQKIGGN